MMDPPSGVRMYKKTFMKFAFLRTYGKTGLWGFNVEEMQNADRMLWSSISKLSLDNATHKVVKVRNGMAIWLQPRPAIAKSARRKIAITAQGRFSSPSPLLVRIDNTGLTVLWRRERRSYFTWTSTRKAGCFRKLIVLEAPAG